MSDPTTNLSSRILRPLTACVLLFLSRAALTGFVIAVPVLYFLWGFLEMRLVLGGAGVVALLFAAYYLSARGLRCGACVDLVILDNGVPACIPQPALPGAGPTEAVGGSPEALFSSISGGVVADRCDEKSRAEPFPGATEEESTDDHAESPAIAPADGCAVKEVPVPARSEALPAVHATPVSLDSGDRPNLSQTKAASLPEVDSISGAGSPADMQPVIRRPLPEEMPTLGLGKDPEPAAPGLKTTSSPVSENGDDKFTNEKLTMNQSQSDCSTTLPLNLFLAAAAQLPPPNPAPLPTHNASRAFDEDSSKAPSFPPAHLSGPEGEPPPWTLPSSQRPAPVIPAPVLPIIRDTTGSLARRPQMTAPPLPAVPLIAPAQLEEFPAPVPAPAASAAMPPALVRYMVEALEEGQRNLSAAFQSTIQRLQDRLSVPVPTDTLVPITPIAPAAPAVSAPSEGVAVSPAPTRRRFARPNGAQARSLSEALADAFGRSEAQAPQPYTNGKLAHHQSSGSVPVMGSLFALAEPPANGLLPHAFLQALGDHFAPNGGAPAPASTANPYDALDDTPMPWMQPVGGRR